MKDKIIVNRQRSINILYADFLTTKGSTVSSRPKCKACYGYNCDCSNDDFLGITPEERLEINNRPHSCNCDCGAGDKIQLLENQNTKLKKCVEFYAEHDNWHDIRDNCNINFQTITDESDFVYGNVGQMYAGETARETLREIEDLSTPVSPLATAVDIDF